MNSHSLLAALILGTSLLPLAAATLKFEKTTVALRLEPGTERTTVEFPFVNDSEETIEIARHAAPCTCLTAAFAHDKMTYAPGEKGLVRAVFDLRNHYGLLSKSVVIWQKGDPPNRPSITLTADITIPEIVAVTPRTLSWETGSEPVAKTFKIIIENKEPVRVSKIDSTNNLFGSELRTIREGWEYELVVTPSDTKKTSFGIFKITTDSPLPRFRTISAFVTLRPGGSR